MSDKVLDIYGDALPSLHAPVFDSWSGSTGFGLCVRCIWGTCSEAIMAWIPFSEHSFSLPTLDNCKRHQVHDRPTLFQRQLQMAGLSLLLDSLLLLAAGDDCTVFSLGFPFSLVTCGALAHVWDVIIWTWHSFQSYCYMWCFNGVNFRCSWPLREKSWLKFFPVKMLSLYVKAWAL